MSDSAAQSHKGVMSIAVIGCILFTLFYVEAAKNAFSWAYSGVKPSLIILWWGLIIFTFLGLGHVMRKGKIAFHSMMAILFYLISHPYLQDILLQLNPLKVASFADVLWPMKSVRSEFAYNELNMLQCAFWIFFPMLLLRIKRWPVYLTSFLVLGTIMFGADKLMGHGGIGLLKLYAVPVASVALLFGLRSDKDWCLGAVRGPLLLILLSFLGHQRLGYFPLGQYQNFEVSYMSPLRASGEALVQEIQAAQKIPACLAEDKKLFLSIAPVEVYPNLKSFFNSGNVANQECIVPLRELKRGDNSFVIKKLRRGEYTAIDYDKTFCRLSASPGSVKNKTLLAELRLLKHTAAASSGMKHVGVDSYIDYHGPVRYWDGKGDGKPVNIFYRQWVPLPAGKHEMIVRFKLGELNRKSPYKHKGMIQLFRAGKDDLINQAEIELSEEEGFTEQVLSFELKKAQGVEFRLLAGDLALYLDSYSYKLEE